MDKIVYLVRHGESIDNAEPVIQAAASPLSERGVQQVGQLAKRFKSIEIDVLLSSVLPRARQTADAIAEAKDMPAEYSDMFVERIRPLSVDGKPWADPVALATYQAWELSLYDAGPAIEAGETYAQIMARVDTVLDQLRDRPEAVITLVTHGHFIRSMLARILFQENLSGTDLRRIQEVVSIQNTSITTLHYKSAYSEEQRWRLVSLNDTSHLTAAVSSTRTHN